MKPPPLLIGAALLFWGWQSGFLLAGAAMAVVLEAPRVLKARWEFSDADFSRIWTFCSLLFLAAAVYSFTANEGPADFSGFFQDPTVQNQHNAGTAAARTAAALFRWLPMLFFCFLTAQAYSTHEAIPLETVSRILRGRWRRARQLGEPLPADRTMNVSYIYFGLCLFAASVHPGEDNSFFWGFGALLVWALWPWRPRRFHFAVWAGALALALALSFTGQVGLNRLARYAMNLNPAWFPFLGHGNKFDHTQSRTSLGQIGRIQNSGTIVLRLQTKDGPAPPLLREASYRVFRGQTWESDLKTNDFETVFSETNNTSWVLLPGKATPVTVNIASYLEGGVDLLPLPTGCGRLENLSAYIVQKSSLGAVLVQGPGLVIFDALYGRGSSMDAPPGTNDLSSIPPQETNALNQVVAELHLTEQSRAEAVRTLNAFFLDHFTYSTWQPPRRTKGGPYETPLTRFLLKTHTGHCEYFATAGVLLLRSAGIPARYAVGYAVHEGSGGKYVVRQRDAHAWCLVWNERTRHWEDVDFTPGSWLAAEGSRASRFQALSDAWSWLKFQLARLRWGQTHLRQYLLWTLVPVLLVLLYQILFRRRRRHTQPTAGTGQSPAWPGLDSEFYLIEQKLAAHGVVRQPAEPLSAWLQRALAEPSLADLKAPLQELLRLHYRYRFDPHGLSENERATLRRQAEGFHGRIPQDVRNTATNLPPR